MDSNKRIEKLKMAAKYGQGSAMLLRQLVPQVLTTEQAEVSRLARDQLKESEKLLSEFENEIDNNKAR